MKKTISFSEFCDGFQGDYKDNFSYEGKQALYNYLEEIEEGTGITIEFDPIAFCCEYSEYKNLKELKDNYNMIETLEDLQDRTQYIPIMNVNGEETEGFIIQDF